MDRSDRAGAGRTHRNNPVDTQPSPDIQLNLGIQPNPDTQLSLGTLLNPAIPRLLEAPLATLRLQVVLLGIRLHREAILLPEEPPGILLHLEATLKPLALPPATLRRPEPPVIPRLPNVPRKLGPPATPPLQEGTRLQEVLPGTLAPPAEPLGTLA